ncbi:MAG: sulfurtransferase [Sediminicola sp.]|tara:strand:- start:19054 stop:19896 length:843 start_codon:yes stop_codon:yes gene_type:complete
MLAPIVSISWLNQHLSDGDLVVLDGSIQENISDLTPSYTDIQIKGARYFDIKNSFCAKDTDLPNMLPSPEEFTAECQKLGINSDSRIIVYDHLGIYSAPRVWWMFRAMGHANVAVLDGGLPEWAKMGLPTEALGATITTTKGNFEANYQPRLVKTSVDILDNLDKKNALVIDARSSGRFYGLIPEPRKDLKGGHVPDSLNLPYTEVLREGKFLPKEELLQLFEHLNLGDRPLIFTCGSGLTACIILLACELVLENHTSVYDGSWSEWGQLENAPITGPEA